MNSLILLVALLFGSQGASALMLDSVFMPLSIEKPSEVIQAVPRLADAEKLARLNASEINGDGTGQLLAQRRWPETLQKPRRILA